MITILRMIRLWQLKIKWKLAIWQFIDKQAAELINSPEKLENKIISAIAKIIYESERVNKVGNEVANAVNQKNKL